MKVYAMSDIKSRDIANLWLICNVRHKSLVAKQTKNKEQN